MERNAAFAYVIERIIFEMSKKQNKAQLTYALLHFFYWMGNSIICGFSSAFLLPNGFSSMEIGLIMGIGNGGAVLVQSVLADYADRTKKVTPARILSAICGLFLIFCGFLLVLKGRSIWMAVFYVLAFIVHTIMMPLLNDLNYRLAEAGNPMSFGAARAFGSLGYSLMSAAAGFLVERFAVSILPILTIGSLLIMLILLHIIGKMLRPGSGQEKEQNRDSGNLLEFARENRNLMFVSIGAMCLMFCAGTSGTYLLQIVLNVGGTAKDMGLALAVAAISEIPVMMFYDRLWQRFSSGKLMKAASVGYLIKQVILFLAGSYPVVLFSQLLQCVSFALYLPSSVAYAHEHTKAKDAVKGQALMTAMSTVAGLLASFLGGFVIDQFGVKSLLGICAAAAVAGIVLIFRFAED